MKTSILHVLVIVSVVMLQVLCDKHAIIEGNSPMTMSALFMFGYDIFLLNLSINFVDFNLTGMYMFVKDCTNN